MSDEWYRGSAWDDEARAFFEKKIGRAKFQKAFYLWVKAAAIAREHPKDADALFQRSLDCDNGFESNRALNAWGAALAERGDVDASLDMLSHCSRQDGANGLYLPTAKWDFAMLAGSNRTRERYDEALELLGPDQDIPAGAFAAHSGLAFIRHDRGEHEAAAMHAIKALERALAQNETIAGLVMAPIAPFPNPFYDRLLVIAGKWDESELGPPPPVWPEDAG